MMERMWYYLQEDKQIGPVRQEDLIRLLSEGTLPAEVYVWADGMADWRPASEVVELGGCLPQPGAADELPPPGAIRPTAVTVFGILNIVFGGLGLLCTPLALLALFLPQQPKGMEMGPVMQAYMFVGYIVGFFCAILLIAMGIGLLNLKRWARQWSYGYGWFAIVWGLIAIAVNIIVFSATLRGVSEEMMPAAVGGLIGGMCGGIVGLIYPIFLVVYMRRPNVIEACQR